MEAIELKLARMAQTETYGDLTSTFTGDFNIAEDLGGIPAVKDTFDSAFASWKHDVRYLANLAIVTNHKSWQHAAGNPELSRLYAECYYVVRDFVYDDDSPLSEADIRYFFEVTD